MTILSILFRQLQLIVIIKARREIRRRLGYEYFARKAPIVLVFMIGLERTSDDIIAAACLQDIKPMYERKLTERPNLPVILPLWGHNDNRCFFLESFGE